MKEVASVRLSQSCTTAVLWQMSYVMPHVTHETYSVIESLVAKRFTSFDYVVGEICTEQNLLRPVRTSASITIESRSDLDQSCPHLCAFLRRRNYVDRIAIQPIHL